MEACNLPLQGSGEDTRSVSAESSVLRKGLPHPVQDPSTPNTEVPRLLFLSLPVLTCQDTQPYPSATSATYTPLPIPSQPGSKETVHTHCVFPHIAWFQLSSLVPNYHSDKNIQHLLDLRASLIQHSFIPLTSQCFMSSFYVPGLCKELDTPLCLLRLAIPFSWEL